MKKILHIAFTLLVVLTVAACKKEVIHSVTFDAQNGSALTEVKVKSGELVSVPTEPTKAEDAEGVWSFTGWYTTAGATSGTEFNFETQIREDITIYAGWSNKIVVRFNTKTSQTISNVELEPGMEVQRPANPTRDGFVFGGWFTTKQGLTWLEETPVGFPHVPAKSVTYYAYWEPVNSTRVNWGENETYVSTLSDPPRMVINPLVYEWSHESDFIDMLVSSMYSTEVDWNQAIKEGIADYPGDFSKFISQEYSIEALDYRYILVGGAQFPMDSNGDTAVVDGEYDRDLAQSMRDTVWTYKLREDLVFQDGTPIDAYTYEYTLKNWIDPDQNNFRANMWYKNDKNQNGRPILNTYEYLNRQALWHDVGFKVIDKYTFQVTTTESISLQSAVGIGNDLRLVHPEKYAASLDRNGVNSQYGTPAHPFVSYGPYVLKSWDENQKMVFNKNYDYVLKGTINYKSQEIQIVSNVDQAMDLFKAGKLSVIGLTKEYYAEYAENPNVKSSWVNFPQYLIVNLSDSKIEGGHKHHPLLFDETFRQALFFGFDRRYFANNVYAPNTPALLPIPVNAKHYLFDPIYYTETPQHLNVLEELGIDIETQGFDATKAVDLFDEVYDAWLAESEDNHGPVVLKLVDDTSDFSDSLLAFIKESYEDLFTKDGVKRLVIDVRRLDSAGLKSAQENFDFDLTLTALGFGSSLDAFWQYPAIALYPALIGAAGFGLNHPYYGDGKIADYINTEIEIDLNNTLNHFNSLDEADYYPEYDELNDLIGEDGIFRGTVHQISMYILMANPSVYDGGPREPFAGASHDLSNITAELEKIFFQYVPVIPTVTRSSATLYADNVTIEWPFYSEAFGWGAARYRYMNTDPDFS